MRHIQLIYTNLISTITISTTITTTVIAIIEPAAAATVVPIEVNGLIYTCYNKFILAGNSNCGCTNVVLAVTVHSPYPLIV